MTPRMPCRITDGPQFEQDASLVEIPDGFTVIGNLPRKFAQELVDEELFESYGKTGKSYSEAMTDCARRGDDIALGQIFCTCIEQAGETLNAQRKWLEWMAS